MMFKESIIQLKEIFKAFLPQNKIEVKLLASFFLFYSSYSIILAINTSIIDYKDLLYDIYFSFDNPIIYRQGYVYLEGHPLMMFITMPFIYLGNILATVFCYKIKTVFLTLLCTTLISLSIIYVHRYLTQVIELKGYIVHILILFFGFTSTNLILSFTPESFTITTFFLCFTIWFYSDYIKKEQNITLASNTFFAVILGGVTITNFAKGIVPMLFTNDNLKSKIKKIAIVCFIFSIIIVWMQIQYDFISLIQNRLTGNISVPARGNYFEKVFDWLYAGPIFFPEIIMLGIKIDGIPFESISLEFYHHWWQYTFSIILLILLIYSFLKNYKNEYMLMIALLLLEDIIIHAIIRYGIRDAFIYGGHWVFLVPFIIGWGYLSIKKERVKSYALVLLTILTITMIINNGIRLTEFTQLALDNFHPY